MLETIISLLKFEIILYLRRSYAWLYPIVFFLIIICFYPLAFSPDPKLLAQLFPGTVWIAVLIASLLSIENIFLSDLEDGFLDQMQLSGHPLSSLILIKLFTHWCMSALPLIVIVPLIGLLLHINLGVLCLLVISLLLITPILILLYGLGIALTIGLKQQGIMLGLIILPFTLPLLIFGVGIIAQAENGYSIVTPILFLSGLSLMASVFLPVLIAMTLKICLDA